MKETLVKTVDVVCGALIRNGKVMIARRVSDVSGGWYEFPGGKVEPGETGPEALKREWQEELGMEITDIQRLADGEDRQPDGLIRLRCYTCTSPQDPELRVHDDMVWTTPDHIYDWHFFESDRHLVEALKRRMEGDALHRQTGQQSDAGQQPE